MGDLALREIFPSGTRGMKDAIFLASQSNNNIITITIIANTAMINVLNLVNAIITCPGLSRES